MKWNGIVSQLAQRTIAARFARAKTAQATSTRLRSNHSITGMSDRLDRCARAELLPETPNADVDHVRARIEVVAPDLGEQPLTADHLAGVLDEMVEETKLTVGQLRRVGADPRLAARHVQRQRPDLQHLLAVSAP